MNKTIQLTFRKSCKLCRVDLGRQWGHAEERLSMEIKVLVLLKLWYFRQQGTVLRREQCGQTLPILDVTKTLTDTIIL